MKFVSNQISMNLTFMLIAFCYLLIVAALLKIFNVLRKRNMNEKNYTHINPRAFDFTTENIFV